MPALLVDSGLLVDPGLLVDSGLSSIWLRQHSLPGTRPRTTGLQDLYAAFT
jgi:hypothetical protein